MWPGVNRLTGLLTNRQPGRTVSSCCMSPMGACPLSIDTQMGPPLIHTHTHQHTAGALWAGQCKWSLGETQSYYYYCHPASQAVWGINDNIPPVPLLRPSQERPHTLCVSEPRPQHRHTTNITLRHWTVTYGWMVSFLFRKRTILKEYYTYKREDTEQTSIQYFLNTLKRKGKMYMNYIA